MNDPLRLPPSDSVDEIASAIVDGQATAAEEALLATDPALAPRVAELQLTRDRIRALATESPIDSARRDAMIQRALSQTAPVVPLSSARRWRRPQPAVLGAAAAAILLVVGFGVLSRRSGDSEKFAAVGNTIGTSNDAASEAASGPGAALDSAGGRASAQAPTGASGSGTGSAAPAASLAAGAASTSPAATTALADLGSFSDEETLRTALRQNPGLLALPTSPSSAAKSFNADSSRCQIDAGNRAVATLRGRPVLIVVDPTSSTSPITIVDIETCTITLQPR